MDQLPPPPPYTPHDPNSPSSETSDQPLIRASIRGGYLNIIDDHEETPLSSAAGYFEHRPLMVPVPLPLMGITYKITPLTTQDDLSYAQRATDLRSHDVSAQDWATFVNFVVAELRNDVQNDPEKENNPMSAEEFQDCLPAIGAVVAEWNKEFFAPRKVLFVPQYTYEGDARPPSPSPSYRTFQTLPPHFPASSHLPTFPPMMPRQMGPHLGPHMIPPHPMRPPHPMGPHQLPGSHYPSSVRIIPPQISHPSLPLLGGRTFGSRHRDGHHDNEHRGRGSHTRGRGHHRRSSSVSSLSSNSSSSSSSSPSSGSDVDSISSDDIEGADEKDIKQSLTTFRLNPTRLENVKSAIRQLHSELHSHRRGIHRGLSYCHRGSIERTCEMKASLKSKQKLIRSEIKAVVKEARTHKKAVKRQHRAEKRIARAEKHYRKVERRVQGSGLGSFPEAMFGSPAGPALDKHNIPSASTTPMGRTTGRTDRIQSWSPGHINTQQESGVINASATYPPDTKPATSTLPTSTKTQTPYLTAEDLARLAETEALSVERRLREMEIHAKKLEKLREAAARQVEKEAERREREVEREAKQREKEAVRLARQREREAQRWEKEARRVERDVERTSEVKTKEAAQRVREFKERKKRREEVNGGRTSLAIPDEGMRQGERCEEQVRGGFGKGGCPATGRGGVRDEAGPSAAGGVAGEGRQGYGAYWENMGKGMEMWGEKFGRDMEQWGEKFGRDMEAKFG